MQAVQHQVGEARPDHTAWLPNETLVPDRTTGLCLMKATPVPLRLTVTEPELV